MAGFFRNYRNAFLVGTLVSSFLILAATYFLYGRGVIGTEAYFVRRLINVATHTVSSGSQPSNPPAPLTVQLNADLVQVTGIALGHPRLEHFRNRVLEANLIAQSRAARRGLWTIFLGTVLQALGTAVPLHWT